MFNETFATVGDMLEEAEREFPSQPKYWRNKDGSVSIEVYADMGDMSCTHIEIIEALFSWEELMARAELSPDTTDEEFEEYGQEAYNEVVKEIWEEIRRNVSYKPKKREYSGDGIDFCDTYIATIVGVI